jgi:RNA polymerase sigma factor (TIGR02999 family)
VETCSPAAATSTGGDVPLATQPLFAAFYAELHGLARRHVSRRALDLPLGATGLVHETYLDMAPREHVFADRGRFLAYASRVMRALIVDHVRSRQTRKRGSEVEVRSLDHDPPAAVPDERVRGRIGAALDALASAEPLLAEIVELRFFGGFSHVEIAARCGLSERTVQRLWHRARAHLRAAMPRP